DTQELINKGQKTGAVMFICAVKKTGEVQWSGTYRASGDVKVLQEEVEHQLSADAQPRFVPAIYDNTPVDVLYYGTVTFSVVNGKPRLRIFSNQQIDDVNKETDFVGPQPVFGGVSKFDGFHYPFRGDDMVLVNGFVEVRMKV